MQFTREVNRIMLGLLIAFSIILISAAYWAIIGPETILLREDNPRRVLAERSLLRGTIFDRNENLLAYTELNDNNIAVRYYPDPSVASTLGYYSYRYGSDGIEAAYDAILTGSERVRDLATTLLDQWLHRPQVGNDIRITLDQQIQAALASAMNGQDGAAIIIRVSDGGILGVVSNPTFDPNTLDANWEMLIEDSRNPFFNRALRGRYQPGSALQTPLMATALLLNEPLENPIEGATHPIEVNGLELQCVVPLPDIPLTLREAYAFACPNAFAQFVQRLEPATLEAAFNTFRLTESPNILPPRTVTGSVQATLTPEVEATEVVVEDEAEIALATALGQGMLDVSPLTMAMMAAAIINDGNSPEPYFLMDTRLHTEATDTAQAWVPQIAIRPSIPLMTTNSARRLQDLLRDAVVNGAAQNAGRPELDIGGHVSIAYSGERTHVWFIGFVTLSTQEAVAIAIVLENSNDIGRVADIGGDALQAAQQALTQSPS